MSDEVFLNEEMKLEIDKTIATLMAKEKHPGISLTITVGDKVQYLRAYGTADFQQNRRMTVDTLVGVGSVSKSFTSLAILQLQEKGHLSIEDPVHTYVPLKLGSKEDPIKIRHLLSHTSGIPNLGTLTFPITRMIPTEYISFIPMSSEADFWSHVNNAASEISVPPEKIFMYNNSAYVMLGMIIEKVTGMSYVEYITQNILDPLKMTRSCYERHRVEKHADRITPYHWPSDGDKSPIAAGFPFEPLGYPAGGLWTTATELSQYLIMLSNQGRFETTQIVKDESLNLAYTPVLLQNPLFEGEEEKGYGLGFYSSTLLGNKMISHGGSMRVSGASFSIFPELKLGLGILSNTISPPYIASKIIKIMGLQSNDSHVERQEEILNQIFERITGVYQTYKGFNTLLVKRQGNYLVLNQESSAHPVNIKNLIFYPDPNLSEKSMTFKSVLAPGIYLDIQFEEDEQGIHLNLERYRYHKV